MALGETITGSIQKQCCVPYQIQCMHGGEPSKLKLADWQGVKNDWWKQLKDTEEKT